MTLFEPDDADETLEVPELLARAGRAISRAFPREVWVRGQIRNLSKSAADHVYFDLAAPTKGGEPPREFIKVALFDSKRQAVNRILTQQSRGIKMQDGIEVRIRGAVQLYGRSSSVQVVMSTIDPAYTLGRLAADRDALLAMLHRDGLLDANAALPVPLVPLRIALVTSAASAAEADVLRHLHDSPYRFDVITIDTRVQGASAAGDIATSLRKAAGLSPVPDMICLVRGGGSRTDLVVFDAEPVARAIATSPVPVLCGVGHEIDQSVADLVAAISVRTPTAVAQWLIDRVATTDGRFIELALAIAAVARRRPAEHRHHVDALADRLARETRRATARSDARLFSTARSIRSATERRITEANQRVDRAGSAVARSTRHRLRQHDHDIVGATKRLQRVALQPIGTERRRLDAIDQRVRVLDPQRLLARGWSITVDDHGRAIRADRLGPGDHISTRVLDGVVASTVTAIERSAPSLDDSTEPKEAP